MFRSKICLTVTDDVLDAQITRVPLIISRHMASTWRAKRRPRQRFRDIPPSPPQIHHLSRLTLQASYALFSLNVPRLANSFTVPSITKSHNIDMPRHIFSPHAASHQPFHHRSTPETLYCRQPELRRHDVRLEERRFRKAATKTIAGR